MSAEFQAPYATGLGLACRRGRLRGAAVSYKHKGRAFDPATLKNLVPLEELVSVIQ